jgi:aspartyl-tRNA(Asn)/glutamyl-tRNA(Gln) amidotransferase subunit B
LKKDNFPIKNFSKAKIDQIIIMLKFLKEGKINNKQGKKIIVEIHKTNATVEHIIDKFNFKQITDEKTLNSLLMQIISSNPKLINEHDTRPEKVEKMIIGKLMEMTKGQANPVLSMSLLKNILKK